MRPAKKCIRHKIYPDKTLNYKSANVALKTSKFIFHIESGVNAIIDMKANCVPAEWIYGIYFSRLSEDWPI